MPRRKDGHFRCIGVEAEHTWKVLEIAQRYSLLSEWGKQLSEWGEGVRAKLGNLKRVWG